MKLTLELVPNTCWFSNVRSQVSKEDWNIIRRECYKNAKYRCEICGDKGPKHPVECHEIFEYDVKTKTQKLARLIALCPNCHTVKHIGFAKVRGKFEEALQHFMEINNISEEEARKEINKAFKIWRSRNEIKDWNLDLTFLEAKNIEIIKDNL